MSALRAPAGLDGPGRRFWRGVVETYELRTDELRLLERAARTLDAVGEMDDRIEADGLMSTGSMGQPTAHPLLMERRLHVALFARLVRQLGLPDDDDADDARPSGPEPPRRVHPELTGPRRRNVT